MDPLLLAGGVIAAAAAKVYWWDRRTPKVTRWDLLLAQWPEIAKMAGIEGAHLERLQGVDYGWEADLQLVPPQTVKHALGVIPALESLLRVRVGAVRVEPNRARADRARLRVVERDPLEVVTDWPGPSGRSILEPIRVGTFETGDPVDVRLPGRHALVAGLTDSGKSSTMQLLVGAAVAAPDAVVAGIDFKGGVELAPWGDALWRLATTKPEAAALLRDGRALLDQRLDWMRRHKLDAWPVSPDCPALILVTDEQGELARLDAGGDLIEHQESIVQRGRAAGIWMVTGIQRPTMKSLGSDTVRGQADTRICHRMMEPRDTDLAFYEGATNAGWTAHQLGPAGSFLIGSREYRVPRPARAFYASKRQVRAVAAEYAGRQPAVMFTRARGSGPERTYKEPETPADTTKRQGSM